MSDTSSENFEEMTDTEHDPLVQNSKPVHQMERLRENKTVQDVLNLFGYRRIHVFYAVTSGFIAMSDSLQAAYIAVALPILT